MYQSRWKIDQVEEFRHYFIKIPVNTPVEFQNSNNSVAKDISKNDDDIDYGRANRLRQLAPERGALI